MSERKETEFESIYRLYKDDIFRTCLLYLKDYHLAEDAAQETLTKLYRKLSLFKRQSSVKTWVIAVCMNTCKDMLRKYKPETALDASIVSPAEDSDTKMTLTQAVSALPEHLREAVILYYYQGLTMKETAAVCKTKIPNIQYRLQKARQLLKSQLGDDFCEPL